MNSTMKKTITLSQEDWLWLARYERDDQTGPAALETLARLESNGLLMRGWGHHYVVTNDGKRALQERDGANKKLSQST